MVGQTFSHYEILEKIGQGGMGVVYRARDTRLERDVALKVLPTGLLADSGFRKRFRNEALALARLNHPNICSVFDFDSEDGVDFLVMEFVPGVSLDQRLATGTIPLDEVPRLGSQLAAGLAAAHEQGVLHRDLKPGNLRVTPDGRLKILDFGLAKVVHPDTNAEATLSTVETSSFSGTVPYMAPEQLNGEPTDARTDIYSAGAVLYEMVTGQRLFPERQLAKLIDAILHQDVRLASKSNRRVPPALENILHKAVDRRADRRYQSARELQIDLDRLATGQVPIAALSRPTSLRGPLLVLISVLLAVGIAGGWYFSRRADRNAVRSAHEAAATPVRARRSVAVLGFKNASGRKDAAWISTALSEMLTTELAGGERLRTVAGENVARTKRDLSLLDADSYAPDTLQHIRMSLGTDTVVLGSYVTVPDRTGGKIRLDLRAQDTASGEMLAQVSETGEQSDLLDVVSRAGARLRAALGISNLSAEDSGRVRASLPQSSEATRLYAEGMEKMRVFDAVAARDLLQKAAAADPSNAMIRAALAGAWYELGYDGRMREEAKKAYDLSRNLPREQALGIEARYYQATRDWGKAAEIWGSLYRVFPDNPEYALSLANAQAFAGDPGDALKTLEQLRASSPALADSPSLDGTEAEIADHLGDFKRQQAAAERAAAKARQRGERLTAARALLLEGNALLNLGDLPKAAAVSREAQSIYEASGNKAGVARAMHNLGLIEISQGKLGEAQKHFEEVVAIRRSIEDNQGLCRALDNLGSIRERHGDLHGAAAIYQESIAIGRRINDQNLVANELANLANVYLAQGRAVEARNMYEQALAMNRAIDDKNGTTAALINLGMMDMDAGNPEAARKNLEEGIQVAEQIGNASAAAQGRNALGNLLFNEGEFESARQNYQQAAEGARKAGDGASAADAQLSVSRVDRLRGDFAASRKGLDQAATFAHDAGEKLLMDESASAMSTLLLAQGDLPGALKIAEQDLVSARKSTDKPVLSDALTDHGEILLYQGDLAGAEKEYRESQLLREGLKQSIGVASVRLELARIALEQGQAEKAANLAREAGAEFQRQKSAELRAEALVLQARADLELRRTAEASDALKEAKTVKSENMPVDFQLQLAVASALVDAAQGVPDAEKNLAGTLAGIGSKASVAVQFAARLALAEINLKSGQNAEAREQLQSLQKDAGEKGFVLYARKAAALQKSTL